MRAETTYHRGCLHRLRYYRDWMDFVSFAERVRDGAHGVDGLGFNGIVRASLGQGDAEWYGTASLDQAIQLAYQGWPEGVERVQEVRNKLDFSDLLPTAQRLLRNVEVAGDEPDIGLFLQGEPEHMVTLHEVEQLQQGKVLRLQLNRSASCDILAEQLVRRGVAILAVVETLLLLGFTIELSIIIAVKEMHYEEQMEFHIPILHAGDPVNLDTLAFMLLHPAVLRRLWFAATECEDNKICNSFQFFSGGGYGKCKDPNVIHGGKPYLAWEDGLLSSDAEIVLYARELLKHLGVNSETAVR